MNRVSLAAVIFVSVLGVGVPDFARGTDLAYLQGKFTPCKQAGFVPVRGGKCLHKDAYQKFKEMAAAAWEDAGIHLFIQSATRNFKYQKGIWERKWKANSRATDETERALKILNWSSMPGTSRHHWGTDADLGHDHCGGDCLVNAGWTGGKGGEAYDWLVKNASRFGFCQPFKGSPGARNGSAYKYGYNEERWHWSYKPLSAGFLNEYAANSSALKPADDAFRGAKAGQQLFDQFVKNVDKSCK